jgi:hypothetical protein
LSRRRYLTVCAVYRDEGPYLREWIEFHRLVGVERFYLYDNLSTDDHAEVLRPYVDSGIVVPHSVTAVPAQMTAYQDCLLRHRDEPRWIAFIDLDEFLFSPLGRPLTELLEDYERWPGIGVNWAVFGTSGHVTKPPGLVIENYTRRTSAAGYNRHIKSIVDPREVRAFGSAHLFMLRSGPTVDEHGRPITGLPSSKSDEVSFERLRVNHYATKSEQEYRRKLARGAADNFRPKGGGLGEDQIRRRIQMMDQVTDETIQMYVPELRSAVEQR